MQQAMMMHKAAAGAPMTTLMSRVCGVASLRGFASAPQRTDESGLRERVAELLPAQQARLRALRTTHGGTSLGEATVGAALGGMRGIKGMLWETSLLDENDGIRFRGYSIPECQALLPAANASAGGEPLPEAMLWLLMTGEVPSHEQTMRLSDELRKRQAVPDSVFEILKHVADEGAHPMTQLSTALMLLQKDSRFARAYAAGVHKSTYWEPSFEDALDIIAKAPVVAAAIYRNTYKPELGRIEADPALDLAANYAHMMGFDSNGMHELMRLYLTIHCDHEGGNVSAHTANVVGSALADGYLSLAAGLNGLAGPLHGLANQEVLLWLNQVREDIGVPPAVTKEQLGDFVRDTLKSGKVVPGYGHAVLRVTDPRYTCQREFALKHLPDDPLFKLVAMLYEVVPDILAATGKVKNPWPNVDAHSGVLLQHYNLTEAQYYTVLFGVSRSMGILSQNVWSRGLGLPIERPKSVTMSWLEEKLAASQ